MSEIQRKSRTHLAELIQTKLMPPRLAERAGLVMRTALLTRLDAGMAHGLVVISAPAGYGKTTLVAQWLATRPEPAAWVALDAGDDDPARFWNYVLTACRAFVPDFGKSARAALRTLQFSPESVLTSFINELAALTLPCILVLEDYHVIMSPQIHASVTYLVEHLPSTLCLVLMTRAELPLSLSRARARNQVYEIGVTDMRFSREETLAFFQQRLPVAANAETIARLDAHTEGWVAGLRLIALALEGKRDAAVIEQLLATFSGGQRYVVEYLVAEVLAALPDPLQQFLLATSILDRLMPSLCDAVAGRRDSDSILAQLERANLFLVPLGDQGSYRYHALFAEAMRQAARERLGADGIRTLYARASVWYEAHGLFDHAIESALAAAQFPRAAALIEQSLDLSSQPKLYNLLRWVEPIPSEVLAIHPTLCFEHAIALLFTSDRYAATTALRLETPLRIAEEIWRREKNDTQLGRVFALRALVLLWQGDLGRAFALARGSLQWLSEDDVFWRSSDLIIVGIEELFAGRVEVAQNVLIEARALSGAARSGPGVLAATCLLADTYVCQGEFDQAALLYHQVQQDAVGGEDMLDDQGSAALGLGSMAYERNDLETAERAAARALELGTQRVNDELSVHAAILLARVLQARGKTEQSQAKLHTAIGHTRHPHLVAEARAWLTRLSLAAGDHASARQWLVTVEQGVPDLPRTVQEQHDLIAARVLIADRKFAHAFKLLDRWRKDAPRHGRTARELEIWLLSALAHARQSQKTPTRHALIRALTIGQAGDYQRIFLDEGTELQSLITDFRTRIEKESPRLRGYIYKILSAFVSEGSQWASKSKIENLKSEIPFVPLSPQEKRVLRLLAAGMSNPEIAHELVVSTNTIKTQLQSIYRKLNVSTREHAREIARELDLT